MTWSLKRNHPKPQSKRGRKRARGQTPAGNRRAGTMRRILGTDPHGPRRN